MPDIVAVERFIILAGATIAAGTALWKWIQDKRAAPIEREKSLLATMALYSEQIDRSRQAQEAMESEMMELRATVAVLQDRVGILESELEKNGIRIPPMKRASDKIPTRPLRQAEMK